MRLDIAFGAVPPRMLLECGARAEERGFRTAWFSETPAGDAFGPATAVATRTSRLRVGTGVVGIWSRSPVTMGLQAAFLNQLSDGRLNLGIGISKGVFQDYHGHKIERPLRAVREYVSILRGIFSGEAVTFEGEMFSVRNFRLQMQLISEPPRIYVGALGPQMARLAGEIGDGVLGACWSVEYLRDVIMPNLRAGAEKAGRTLDDFDIVCALPTLVGDDGLEQIKPDVLKFASMRIAAAAYEESFAAAGYGDEVQEINDRLQAADIAGALGVVTDQMADTITIAGPPEHARTRIAAYQAAGLNAVSLISTPPAFYWKPWTRGVILTADPGKSEAELTAIQGKLMTRGGDLFPEYSVPAHLAQIDGALALGIGSD